MNSSKLFVAAVVAVSVVSAATYAYAQSSTPAPGQQPATMPQTPTPNQTQDLGQPTAPGNNPVNNPVNRANAEAERLNLANNSGSTGTASDGSGMVSQSDGSVISNEPAARADRK